MANLADGSSNKTSFTIDDDGSGNVWLLGWTKSTSPKVNFTVQAPPAPTTSRSASSYVASATATSSTARPSNGATGLGEDRAQAIVFAIAAILAVVEA